ncbi:monodechloroaminopyrrolnitrin synthase PrnB family protein [Ekhidna sp.]|uniref:monodechloroaminopyrrolnitrin synthase PrnB family protein n=1 Tax=Ekhidna sp. TaxID=2608089 RepID=UPI0032979FD9
MDNSEDITISNLDPLCADDIMKSIPKINEKGDIKSLSSILQSFCSQIDLDNFNHFERLAAIRDVGIILGSLKRHNLEPIKCVPDIEPILIRYGQLTELPPRDILYHYTVWNPNNGRLRKYTNHHQEPDLIDSIRISIPHIRKATRLLITLMDIDPHSLESLETAFEIDSELRLFLNGLAHAKETVDPGVFINEFRPFFEPITVNNQEHGGPGAVTMPLHIFDFLLWGTSDKSKMVQDFTSDYVPYNTKDFRIAYKNVLGKPSYLDIIERAFEETNHKKIIYPLIYAVSNWFKRINGFRMSHYKYAIQAYDGEYYHNFETGSGGHTTSDLNLLSEITKNNEERIKTLMNTRL